MFYTYYQNNSGGRWTNDDNVNQYVIIEAESAELANEKAETIGIYFEGVNRGRDCECCGDRWDRARETEGTKTPTIYSGDVKNLSSYNSMMPSNSKTAIIVYYRDGKKEIHRKQK
jgi:hypothetical protein